jgi:hypothetical protein
MSVEPEYIEFKVVKEDWNWYNLADGSRIKTKIVLIKILREEIDEVGNPVYGMNTKNVIGVIPPKKFKLRPPSKRPYSSQEIIDAIVESNLKFETIKEDWNKYELEDGTSMYLKLIVTQVNKTSLFDSRGEPIYNIQSQVIAKGDISDELRKKLRKLVENPR